MTSANAPTPYTLLYAAPERRRDPLARATTAMDIFSLGVVIIALILRREPIPSGQSYSEMIDETSNRTAQNERDDFKNWAKLRGVRGVAK